MDPYRIWYAAGALYLIGYCHMRREVRMFAVDRILALTVTNLPCQMPLGFGPGVRVIKPASLFVRLKSAAMEIASQD